MLYPGKQPGRHDRMATVQALTYSIVYALSIETILCGVWLKRMEQCRVLV